MERQFHTAIPSRGNNDMANACMRASRFGPLTALTCGLVLAGGWACGWIPAAAQDQPKPAAGPAGFIPEQTRVINEQIAAKWKVEGLTPSARCDDYTFIRRVSLDIIGRIATPEEIDRFFKDPQ